MNGLIVTVTDLEPCVQFYATKIGLPIQMRKTGLVRFLLGTMYLQIEDTGTSGLGRTRNIILRTNVPDLDAVSRELQARGVTLEIHDLEWGKIGFTHDPDGNKFEYLQEK